MAVKYTNNASNYLAKAITTTDTQIELQNSISFPEIGVDDFFYLTIADNTNKEIVKVTSISGNVFTVIRAQDDTTACEFAVDTLAEIRITAALLRALEQSAGYAFIGSATQDPALRANSNPLQAGDMYYNSIIQTLKQYSGTEWEAFGSTALAQMQGILESAIAEKEAAKKLKKDAETAAQAAKQARDAAMAVYDGFDDRYLGAKTLPPTTDNDGNPLFGGALYFDETLEIMRVWNGSAWKQAYIQADDIVVNREHLADGCVHSEQLANGCVTHEHLADGCINNSKIEPASIEPSALRNTDADKVALRDRFDIPSKQDVKNNQYLQAVTMKNKAISLDDFNRLIRAEDVISIPSHAGVPFPAGFIVHMTNQSGTDVIIHRHGGVRLYLAGSNGTNKDFRLHNYGMCMLVQTSINNWFISGVGIE